jgi:capsular exopolysaccharide synthesis family protein
MTTGTTSSTGESTDPALRVPAAGVRSPSDTLIRRMERESPVATEARRIVGHLLRKEPASLRTVLVTSAEPFEGKSTLSGFLAIAAAQYLKKKTLLIDADLRRPALTRLMGAEEEKPGLADWLAGGLRRPLVDCIQRTPLERLSILGSGRRLNDPGLLLETEKVEQLVKECARLFDLVLIDTPPLLPVTDPLVFTPLCDATVLVIKAGVTQRQSVRRALQLVRQAGGHVAGCILNDLAQALPGYYSASYYVDPRT